ncbi:MAG: diguanylate cyclase (GGDEF)-like protein/PAS domain S-box-containing protein [Janthinobacterium sp.]|jgi:diguanylate cyclase (GGDEF)-like protein/PAS domain S-box-containing protein
MYFTLYSDVTDIFNLMGHLYKLISYVMVYRAIFVSGVHAPYLQMDLEHGRLQALLATIPDPIWLKDVNGVFLACNKAFERLYGATESDIVGKTGDDFNHHERADFFIWNGHATTSTMPLINEEWLTFALDGYRGLFETTQAPMSGADGSVIGVIGIIGIAHDITSRKNAEDKIRNLAFFDPLTHLPNRRLLLDRLNQAIASNGRSKRNSALLYIDLDNFKSINDSLGHDTGDMLLEQVAKRLVDCMRKGDTVARLGGDEFLIILNDLSTSASKAVKHAEAATKKNSVNTEPAVPARQLRASQHVQHWHHAARWT